MKKNTHTYLCLLYLSANFSEKFSIRNEVEKTSNDVSWTLIQWNVNLDSWTWNVWIAWCGGDRTYSCRIVIDIDDVSCVAKSQIDQLKSIWSIESMQSAHWSCMTIVLLIHFSFSFFFANEPKWIHWLNYHHIQKRQ